MRLRELEKTASVRDQAQRERGSFGSRPKKKLSYLEQREYDTSKPASRGRRPPRRGARAPASPDVVSDPKKIEEAYAELNSAQAEVDALYARWEELESKLAGGEGSAIS